MKASVIDAVRKLDLQINFLIALLSQVGADYEVHIAAVIYQHQVERERIKANERNSTIHLWMGRCV